jgi:predicted tellurium resistance membrane protein TerC
VREAFFMAISWLTDPQVWASLVTLTALEIVLGIDNLVFIAILADRLPPDRRAAARRVGLSLALITRLALLASIAWILGLTRPVFAVFGHDFSWRDIILIGGGLFLLHKGTREIHLRVEGEDEAPRQGGRAAPSFGGIVVQIMILDIVFSLDSVITAVGMANELWVMAVAIIVAVVIMLAASGPLAGFVERNPTVKMLALSFLLLIGMTLIADGAGFHLPRGYIYTAIGFSVAVEALNQLVARRRRMPGVPDKEGGTHPGSAGS